MKQLMTVQQRAREAWGDEAQIDMAIEEMAELTVALMHFKRGREHNALEELADVKNMIVQLDDIFSDNAVEIENWRQEKLARLSGRLDAEEE